MKFFSHSKSCTLFPLLKEPCQAKKCFLQSLSLIKDSNIYTIKKPLKNNDYLNIFDGKSVSLLQQGVEK
jgi:hypothetical protein